MRIGTAFNLFLSIAAPCKFEVLSAVFKFLMLPLDAPTLLFPDETDCDAVQLANKKTGNKKVLYSFIIENYFCFIRISTFYTQRQSLSMNILFTRNFATNVTTIFSSYC